MERDEFIKAGYYLYGKHWRSRIAEALCVDRSSVTRWASGATKVLPLAAVTIQLLVEKKVRDHDERSNSAGSS